MLSSVIMDETADLSCGEQVSIVLRYCVESIVTESFVGFYDINSTTGENLFNLLCEKLAEFNLDVNKLVGLGFDGAASMSGRFKGVSARMKEVAPQSLYVHCYGHLLNLALQAAMCNILNLRNCIGTVQSLSVFIEASPKRHAIFQEIQKNTGECQIALKDQSDTRWSC